MLDLFRSGREDLHGIIHCSGGGQTKVLHFAEESLHIVKDDLFDTPPLFRLIQEHSGTAWHEMYKVYNMGHRMEVYTTKEHAPNVIEAADKHGVSARVIGRVEERAGDSPRLTIHGPAGMEQYS